MNKALKIVLEVILFIGIVGLVYAIYSSIMKPVNFNKQKEKREAVAIQRLKDIRTLQVAYKSVNGKFVSVGVAAFQAPDGAWYWAQAFGY